MASITPPKYVRQVLIKLQTHNHLAYLVGGCVRDMLLGVHPADWDICTSALPQEVMEIFPGSLTTGLKHGTVTVKINSRLVEVTTFRSEGNYGDHRHPDAVSFVGDLNADLSRRDFTINAIAMPPDGLVADPFGGMADIEKGIIRCVGDPEFRFEEDALRMFRALRFSAKLGFSIEEKTMEAIEKKAPLASFVAAERIRAELEKLLLSPAPEKIFEVIDLGLLDRFLLKRVEDSIGFIRLSRLPRKAMYRWAALCVILLHYGCIRSASEFLSALRLDCRSIRCCSDTVDIIYGGKPKSRLEWKKLLHRYGVDSVSCAASCSDALRGGSCAKEVKRILKSGECFSMKHLAVTGDDLLALGFRGRELGEMLNFLLQYVMEFPENNRREILLSLAESGEEQ
ncbi:MAG: CCA tRNA nucleotidyltransferase [Candidatus Limivicinus sp.]|jgi:tRNA nucleotidyltransferase (CCA-adding enzyme)